MRAPLEPRASLLLCATFALHAPHPHLSFLEWSETLKGGLYGCSVKKTDFVNLAKFGHFWGGIAAKICICAKYAFVQKSAAFLVCYGSELPKKIYVNHQTLGRFEAL